MAEAFISRRDVKAIQHADGSWSPIRQPFKLDDFRAHFAGTKTLGHYMLSDEGKTKLLAFDLDLRASKPDADPPVLFYRDDDEYDPRESWLDPDSPHRDHLCVALRITADMIADEATRVFGCPVAMADSGGKGLHVYVLTGERDAKITRMWGRRMMTKLGFVNTRGENFFVTDADALVEVEMFPKQDSLDGKDLGNLMKLPMGIHQKTRRRSEFITMNANHDTLLAMDPFLALDGEGCA